MNINLGCGKNKLEDYINVDADPEMNPDVVLVLGKDKFPWETESIDRVVMGHTLEHIPRDFHFRILNEINRVLKIDGDLMVSFPDFEKISKNYLENLHGVQDFWEKTIYGRRLTPWDYHVCAMVGIDFCRFIKDFGFHKIQLSCEVNADYNSVVYARKAFTLTPKEELLRRDIRGENH